MLIRVEIIIAYGKEVRFSVLLSYTNFFYYCFQKFAFLLAVQIHIVKKESVYV